MKLKNIYFIYVRDIFVHYKWYNCCFSRELAGAETAQFASGYGIAPFPDYGANMVQYGPNRGLRNQNNFGGGMNNQGFNGGLGRGRGVGNLQGNFQNGAFQNKGKNQKL